MTGRIVLFLGERTKAKLARYAKWDQANQASACETLFPWSVLMADAEGASKAGSIQVVAICSASTYGDWEYGVADDACDAGYTDRDRIPIGLFQYDDNALGPDSFWGLFDMLRLATGGDTLSEQPGFGVERKSPKDAFSTPADHVVVDITHGFRSVPFLGASALAFAQAANRRRGRSVTHRIYYAAKDAGQNEVIPVWDLTPFVEGVELGDALDAFSRHGRSDDLASFFKSSQVQAARDIAQPMKQFADDLLL
jgi:CRISPR-associated DxTHG motif protein